MTETRYELVKRSSRVFLTVSAEGIVVKAESPTHGCFRPNFLGEPWAKVRVDLEQDGFIVHAGN